MIIYNLTDRTPPWEKIPRVGRPVKIAGRVIQAGKSLDVGYIPLRSVSGLIISHIISVDNIPGWYQKVGDKQHWLESKKLEEISPLLEESIRSKKKKRKLDD